MPIKKKEIKLNLLGKTLILEYTRLLFKAAVTKPFVLMMDGRCGENGVEPEGWKSWLVLSILENNITKQALMLLPKRKKLK